jgi:DNA end-binding protein Ku
VPRRRRERGRDDEHAPVARGVWSGTLSFGLVTVPVELYAAQRPRGVSLRMLTPDGVPLARRYICPEHERALDRDEIVRGYATGEGKFVVVSDEELERLAARRSRDIELVRFVPRDAIDPAWFVRCWFLVPSGSTKAYRLLAEIMQASGRAAIASFVMRDREYAVAIFADDGILRAETLRFGDELRTPADVDLPTPKKVEATRVKKLARAVDALAEKALDPRELEDDADERLLALARRKLARGEDVVEMPSELREEADGEEGAEVIDLVALLQQRLRGGARGARELKRVRPRGRAKPREKSSRRSARAR